MFESTLLLVAAKAATVTFGGLLTFLTFRAYRRTGSHAMRALLTGIGLVMLGVILGGVLYEVAGTSLAFSVTVQAVFTAFGFGVLTYSLYVEQSTDFSRPAGRAGRHS